MGDSKGGGFVFLLIFIIAAYIYFDINQFSDEPIEYEPKTTIANYYDNNYYKEPEYVTPAPTQRQIETPTTAPSYKPVEQPTIKPIETVNNAEYDRVLEKYDNETYYGQPNKYYYYNQLTYSEKKVYDVIEKELKKFNGKIQLDKVSIKDMEFATYAITMDHPEFFWTNRYTYTTINREYVTEVIYSIPYDAQEKTQKIESKVNSIMSGQYSTLTSDYDRLKYFYDWIVNSTDYGETSDSQEITSVFIGNVSVCAGYSKAFLYLCQKVGIECAYVPGTAKGYESHGWNLVKLNNKYYWVDVTWGDPVYAGGNSNSINYNYFLVDDSEIFSNHAINYKIDFTSNNMQDRNFTYPNCTDDSLNYYKMNGAYFTNYSIWSVRNYFQGKFRNRIYKDIEIKFKEKSQYEEFLHDYIQQDDPYIYEDIKTVNPTFYGTMQVFYSTVDSSNYVKVTVVLE